MISSRRCDLQTDECYFDKYACHYDTHEYSFDTLECDLYTQRVIFTRIVIFIRMSTISLTCMITARTSVIYKKQVEL
jgi:hypothetical protein